MEEQSRTLLSCKDREMVQAGLLDELHYRIEQLGAPGGDDCLTLLHMLERLTFMRDSEVNRTLAHQVLPLLKDGLGRLVERFCAIEPGEPDSSCLSEKIQNYAKAISLIAGWNFPSAAAVQPTEPALPEGEEPCEEPAEEEKPCEEPAAAAPECASEPAPPVEPSAVEEEVPAEEPGCGAPAEPAVEPVCSEAEPAQAPTEEECDPCCDGDVEPER